MKLKLLLFTYILYSAFSANIIPDWKVIKPEGIIPEVQGTVVGLGCIESAFLFHAAPSINDFMHPDLPALMLYLQYLTQLEGPLWRQIRGQGFAYGYNIIPRPNEGLLCLTLYRATNVVAAFKEAKNTIVSLRTFRLKMGKFELI